MSVAKSERDLPEREINLDFPNRYTADRPVDRDGICLPGPHVEVQKRLEEMAISPDTGMCVILGQRRTGKTTLLYRAIESIEQTEKDCLPIYINSILFERDKPWKPSDFLGTMARIIRTRVTLTHPKLEDRLPEIPPLGPISTKEFVRNVHQICQIVDRKILFIFDDADVFGERCGPADERKLFPNFKRILKTFADLAYPDEASNKIGFSVVFATGEGMDISWIEKLKDVAPKTQILRLPLFNKEETQQLAHPEDVPLRYDDHAVDYLYKMTGGHPALTQLICSRVIGNWSRAGKQGLEISEYEVETAVEDLIANPKLEGIFTYLFEFSIPHDGRQLLKKLVEKEAIHPRILFIDRYKLKPGDVPIVDRLKEIKVLDEDEKYGTLLLRIGFFGSWLESLHHRRLTWASI